MKDYRMSEADAYRGFRLAESFFEGEYKRGNLTREQVKKYIDEARRNYKRRALNREIDMAEKTA